MAFTDYLENKLLAHTFSNTAYTSPSTVYVALYTVAPTDSSAGTEVTGGGLRSAVGELYNDRQRDD